MPRIRPTAFVVVAGLVFASCGSDDAAESPTSSAGTTAPSTEATIDTGDDQTTATSAPTTEGTTAPSTEPSTEPTTPTTGSSPATAPGEPSDDIAPVCAAFESLFTAGLVSSFAAFDDPTVIDPLLLGFMPAIASRFEAAVAVLPADDVAPELEQTLRDVTVVFAAAADAVQDAGITDADVERLGSVLDPGVLDAGPGDGDVGDLIDDDVLERLRSVQFDLDDELAGVPEPDESVLGALCPSIADFFGPGATTFEDACSLVDDVALGVVFAEPFPVFDLDDVDTGMCVWEDPAADRELVVSVTDRATVDQTRTGNEPSNDVVTIDGLGDDAWVIDGLLTGTSSSGGRGGFGAGRATVGVVDGSRGVLVAVRAPDGDAVALATDVATILLGG